MPRARFAQLQAPGHAVPDGGAAAAEGVERADGAAELDAQRAVAGLGEAEPAAVERGRPARDLHAGRDRGGGLHECAAEHHDAGVTPGVASQAAHRRRQHVVGLGEAGFQAEDESGVEHILARRAVVHEGRRAPVGAGDLLGERLHQGNRQRARPLPVAGQPLRCRAQLGTGGRDDARGLRGDDAGVAFGLGQRALEVEHRPHERVGGQGLHERVAREAPADEVHGDRRPGVSTRGRPLRRFRAGGRPTDRSSDPSGRGSRSACEADRDHRSPARGGRP